MSMKKLAVAAALTLCAFGASASNFRGADQVYIPAAGNFQGASGRFVSDVYLANLTGDEVEVSVIFQQIGAGGGLGTEFKNLIVLKPHERREFKNFLRDTLNLQVGNEFGQLIFNGCLKGFSCGEDSQDDQGDSDNFRDISATSRVYLIPNGSGANPLTTGQLFTGIPWYHFVSTLQANNGLDKVFIQGFRQTGDPGVAGTFRSNIGLVNASQWSRSTIVVTLYQGSLTPADRKTSFEVTLEPLGSIQQGFTQMFPGFTGENYFITVEQTNPEAVGNDIPDSCLNGCPAFLAYGSVLDNGSGDATTLEAQYLSALTDTAVLTIYPNPAGKTNMYRSVRH
jgi:hypothetical protein